MTFSEFLAVFRPKAHDALSNFSQNVSYLRALDFEHQQKVLDFLEGFASDYGFFEPFSVFDVIFVNHRLHPYDLENRSASYDSEFWAKSHDGSPVCSSFLINRLTDVLSGFDQAFQKTAIITDPCTFFSEDLVDLFVQVKEEKDNRDQLPVLTYSNLDGVFPDLRMSWFYTILTDDVLFQVFGHIAQNKPNAKQILEYLKKNSDALWIENPSIEHLATLILGARIYRDLTLPRYFCDSYDDGFFTLSIGNIGRNKKTRLTRDLFSPNYTRWGLQKLDWSDLKFSASNRFRILYDRTEKARSMIKMIEDLKKAEATDDWAEKLSKRL